MAKFTLTPWMGTPPLIVQTPYPRIDKCSRSSCDARFMKLAAKQFCPECRPLMKKQAEARRYRRRVKP